MVYIVSEDITFHSLVATGKLAMCPTAEQNSIWESELSHILQVHDTNL